MDEEKGQVTERKYRFRLRMLDGTYPYISTGKDVSDASDNLAKKLNMEEISSIMEGDLPDIWNPKDEKWVRARPWWEEDKEPYPWE